MSKQPMTHKQMMRAITATLAEGEPHLDMDERPLGERIAAPPAPIDPRDARIAELEAALKWLEFAVRDDVRDYEQKDQLSQALPAAWAVLGDADPDARTLGAIAAMGEALVSARADAAEAEAEP